MKLRTFIKTVDSALAIVPVFRVLKNVGDLTKGDLLVFKDESFYKLASGTGLVLESSWAIDLDPEQVKFDSFRVAKQSVWDTL